MSSETARRRRLLPSLMRGAPERDDPPPLRRRGKEIRERVAAGLLLALTSPLYAAIAAAIRIEGWLDPDARGPVHISEQRISRGRVIDLLKFRTLRRPVLDGLGPGPTHIKLLEADENLTRTGHFLKAWYLDEYPQLINILRGDMFLVGTRPYPLEYYEAEMKMGVTRKHEMPAGLVGPVQAAKGDRLDGVQLDQEYWHAFRAYDTWELLKLDLRIIWETFRTQLRHEGL